jgi:glutaredoxin
MYVKPNCPYCAQARAALDEDGRAYEERDATADRSYRDELMRFSRGSGMVPTIVEDDRVVSVGWNGHG